MMRTLRDRKTMQAILWFVIVCFVIGFIFLAVGSKFQMINTSRDPNMLAKVGDWKITYAEFNKECQPALDKLYGMKNETPSPEEIKKLKEQVLERLIDDAILRQTALKLGLSVPDEELIGWLQHQSFFMDESGRFDKKRYYQLLQANQMTPEQFEAIQRQEMLVQKIRSLLSDGVLYASDDLTHYYDLLKREMTASYVVLDPAKYEKNLKLSDSDLKDYYESNKSRYDHPERAKIRHILIGLPATSSPADEAKAKATLEDCRKQILSKKAKFTELAAKYSVDGSSKDRGGELGWVPRKALGPDMQEFEDALFKLKKGELTKPIKTKYGLHLAQLEDYEGEYKSTFEEVRSKVKDSLEKQKATEKVIALSEGLVEKLRKREDLGKAAEALGLSISTTSWFKRDAGITGIKDSKEFSQELSALYLKDWKGPLVTGSKDYFFQITAVRPTQGSKEKWEDVRGEIAQRLNGARQDAWLKNFLQQQRKKLNVKSYLES